MKTIYDFAVPLPDGTEQSLRDYAGQVMLIANTASKCGFTPQFEGLQKLYEQFKDDGLVVLGFPCDQFKQQEFAEIDETLAFCRTNYGVTFPMFAKIDVNGSDEHPLYTYLKKKKGGLFARAIKWNFTKFLIDRHGQVVARYAPMTEPSELAKHIATCLEVQITDGTH